MDHRKDVRDFLVSRRARLSPKQAGLPSYGGQRRVPGLRREEVALLAGMSVDYYSRIERGSLRGASDSVLEALARALQLDEAEREHLIDLARHSAAPPRLVRRPSTPTLRPEVRSILSGMTTVPAYVRTARMDILAANELARALFGGVVDPDRLPLNLARYLFLDPHSRGFFVEWDKVADDLVGALRVHAGRDPRDTSLSDLVGELSTCIGPDCPPASTQHPPDRRHRLRTDHRDWFPDRIGAARNLRRQRGAHPGGARHHRDRGPASPGLSFTPARPAGYPPLRRVR